MSTSPAWLVHVPTADTTTLRVVSRPARDGEGWPLPRLLADAAPLGLERAGAPRALGTGQGVPLVHSVEARWQGCDLHVEARLDRHSRRTELTLELPTWDELESRVASEEVLWELIDAAAAASEAEHGCFGDGEPLEPEPPGDRAGWEQRCRRHAGVLADEGAAAIAGWAAAVYRSLPRSGLVVLLR